MHACMRMHNETVSPHLVSGGLMDATNPANAQEGGRPLILFLHMCDYTWLLNSRHAATEQQTSFRALT